jgi:predicted lipoprotein with Yx(FWY)xxD motif
MQHVRITSALAVAGIAVILAGCAAQSGAGNSPAASNPMAAGGSPTVLSVDLHQDADLGPILAGVGGKTLYVLTKDSSGTSTCTGTCATTWPPFTLAAGGSAVAGSGVTGTIGTIMRPDGSTQVAINGQPLYYYSGDAAAGDTNGEGTNGVWFVAGASGSPVQAPSPSATSGGYHY